MFIRYDELITNTGGRAMNKCTYQVLIGYAHNEESGNNQSDEFNT